MKHLDLLRVDDYLSEYFCKINIIYHAVKVSVLLFFIFWNIVSINAQLKEQFESFDAWQLDTSQWKIADDALQSNCQLANASFEASIANALVVNCVWKLYCSLKFSTSSLNYVDFYLLSNSKNLSSATNAYFVRIGATADDICLYKKTNATLLKLIDGIDGRSQSSSSNNQIQIKVTRQGNGNWVLATDIKTSGSNYIEEGKAIDSTFMNGNFAGIMVHQSSAGFFGKHFFDNLYIETIAEDSLDNLLPIESLVKKGELVISEVLFNPKPNGVDFIELYNAADAPIALASLALANEKGDTVNFQSESLMILPKSYLGMSSNSNSTATDFPYYSNKNLYQAKKLPSMNDDQGQIQLLNSNMEILDQFNYHEKMHYELINDNEGVSLEKINLGLPSENSNWHSASSTVGYGTPGHLNSQNFNNVILKDNFSISTKIISPNQDGYNDYALLQYQLPQLGNVATIYVYNTAGEIVKQLANNHLLSTVGQYQWDGVTDSGIKAPNGYYFIRVDLFDGEGNNKVAELPLVLWTD